MDASGLLRAVRTRAGLSLRQLAARADTSNPTLSAYETGRVTPRVDTLVRVVEAAGWRLAPTLEPVPKRDPRRASSGEELWQVLLLADVLPTRGRHERPQAPHTIFRPG
jgi:transcriptional regulator with XRE-family HTH domain